MTGLVSPSSVVQFRAIQYATIPARFEQSVLATSLPADKAGDYTENGYACPHTFPTGETSGGLLPGESTDPRSDEFGCLILQLNIPLAHLQSLSFSPSSTPSRSLPVLIYIHGGGFVLGKIDAQHSTALMVEQSQSTSPIISASIQYRLGALGYLHTPSPGTANLALNDQRNALLWIQKFIGGFGGDKGRVTVFGESAGSMSICGHMMYRGNDRVEKGIRGGSKSKKGLFQRAILMSGVVGPMTAPAEKKEAEGVYEVFLSKCGIEERGDEGLQRLRELDVKRIVEMTDEMAGDGAMWLSVRDEQWFGGDAEEVTWDRAPELIGRCEWVDEIVMGSTSFEGTMFLERMAAVTPRAFIAGITKQLGEESARLISNAYGITADMDQNLFTTMALRWIGDVVFDAPNHNLARYLTTHTNKKVYRYIFDVRSPFPGSPFYQLAHHWVDIYFVFKTFQFRYPTQRLKALSTRHAQLWIDFTNGKTPWIEYEYTGNGDEVVMVADEREGWIERTVAEDEKITETTWRRCEALVESWEARRGMSFAPLDVKFLKGKKLV